MQLQDLKFDENGLIPAVVQDATTRQVLTVAYMNAESLAITLTEGKTCFWSRSRQQLWRKGETSGNVQHVVQVIADCDGDALVVLVNKEGPACHLGTESCFSTLIWSAADEEVPIQEPKTSAQQPFSLEALYSLLQQRNMQRPQGSYTTYLFEKGREKILKKVGEECTEVIIGAMKQDTRETVYEIADLCYHVLVLMVEMGLSVEDIRAELAGRHIIDHKVKQETPL